jgi:hypothetical protein
VYKSIGELIKESNGCTKTALEKHKEQQKVWSAKQMFYGSWPFKRPKSYVQHSLSVGDCRPAFATPVVFEHQLKPGFHWPELTH